MQVGKQVGSKYVQVDKKTTFKQVGAKLNLFIPT